MIFQETLGILLVGLVRIALTTSALSVLSALRVFSLLNWTFVVLEMGKSADVPHACHIRLDVQTQ